MNLPIGIPSLDALDEVTRQAITPIKEIVETREGRRGNPRARFATFQDLIDLGLITETEADEHIAEL